jgi:hypothetical protein
MALWRWRRDSEDGISEFQEIEYRGVVQPLHRHLEDAIEQSIDEIESTLRASARDGFMRPVIHHGQFQYEDDEYACSLSDAAFETELALVGGVWPDKKRRVKNEQTGVWERVKIMEHIRPTTEAQVAVLRAWSERYADKRSVKFEGNMQVGYGATTIGKPLAPPAALPQLQVITPALADQVNETEAVFEEEEDEMTSLTPRPPLPEPDPSSPLTEEQQAILARARSGNALAADLAARALARKPAPSAAPPPAVPVYRGDLDQPDDVPRTPRGTKIV